MAILSILFPVTPHIGPDFPMAFRIGGTIAVSIAIAFSCGYASHAAAEAKRMALALHVTETVLSREQRLSALGGLAAAAAHELGTPLATITIVARELARDLPPGAGRDDALLMVEQAGRCRDILKRLAETPGGDRRGPRTDDAAAARPRNSGALRQGGRNPLRRSRGGGGHGVSGVAAPDVWRQPEVLHALASFVENAFDFAKAEILVTARFDAETIAIEVRDDGPGFAPEVVARLGEPYVTSRPGAEGSRTGHVGMGLGFFICQDPARTHGRSGHVPQRQTRRRRGRHGPLAPLVDGSEGEFEGRP